MDWNDLRYVLETARQNGLSGAARVLGVNHATVARRIGAAEAALHATLFDRLPTGYRPTAAGLAAVRTAEAVDWEFAAILFPLMHFECNAGQWMNRNLMAFGARYLRGAQAIIASK